VKGQPFRATDQTPRPMANTALIHEAIVMTYGKNIWFIVVCFNMKWKGKRMNDDDECLTDIM